LRPPTRHKQHHSIANMADQQPPAAAPAGEASKDLHTDPVTGEKISKSELKRRQKQREKDEKKKEKEAALPARPKKEGKKDDVEELNPNVRVINGVAIGTRNC
jgi:lysyl-tRNA synthetase class 2